MTTSVTNSELGLLYVGLMLAAIIGVFMFFYVQEPIQEVSVPGSATANSSTVTSDEASWINDIVSPTMGLPIGASEILVVSAIFLSPFIVMLASVAIRYAKDLISGWV